MCAARHISKASAKNPDQEGEEKNETMRMYSRIPRECYSRRQPHTPCRQRQNKTNPDLSATQREGKGKRRELKNDMQTKKSRKKKGKLNMIVSNLAWPGLAYPGRFLQAAFVSRARLNTMHKNQRKRQRNPTCTKYASVLHQRRLYAESSLVCRRLGLEALPDC